MAKKRKRKSSRGRRRSSGRRVSRRRGRRGGGGGGVSYGIMPNRGEVENLVASGVYGFLEAQAVKDPKFLLNSIPRPVAQLGYAGGIALALRVVNSLAIKNRYVGLLANAAAQVAMYQFGRLGKLPAASAAPAVISGLDFLGEDDMGDDMGDYIDDDIAGELEGEADGLDGDDAAEAMGTLGATSNTVEAMNARKGRLET